MKKTLLILFIPLLLVGCSNSNPFDDFKIDDFKIDDKISIYERGLYKICINKKCERFYEKNYIDELESELKNDIKLLRDYLGVVEFIELEKTYLTDDPLKIEYKRRVCDKYTTIMCLDNETEDECNSRDRDYYLECQKLKELINK